MKYIVYPSGSHGNFLKLLLNELSGIQAEVPDSMVYDTVKYLTSPSFSAFHQVSAIQKLFQTNVDYESMINIKVRPTSYLKYFAVCLNRTSGQFVTVENLHVDTFDQISKHSVLFDFVNSLAVIAGKSHGDVEPQFLREWFRLCFFANNGDTITQFIKPNIIPQAKFTVDFECFYDDTIIAICENILESMDLSITKSSRLDQYLKDFKQKNLYFDIDLNIKTWLDAIDQGTEADLTQSNLLQQAWIDNYLVKKYNIDPLLRNEYFANTLELIDEYKLKKGKV